MKKNTLYLGLLLSLPVAAQHVAVNEVQQIKFPGIEKMYHPTLSADGALLCFSAIDYEGLEMVDLKTQKVTTLSEANGAGYKPIVRANDVYFRQISFNNQRRETRLFHYDGDKTKAASQSLRSITGFHINQDALNFTSNEQLFAAPSATKAVKSASNKAVVSVEDLKLAIYQGGKREVITPNGENERYLWASFSPDNEKIVYKVVGKGTFVYSTIDKTTKHIGTINAPVWAGNDYIVGMQDNDNGEYVTSSTICAVHIATGKKDIISVPEHLIAMYPSATQDGNKVAYHTEEGEVYIVTLTYSK